MAKINSEVSKKNIVRGTRRRVNFNYNEVLSTKNNGAIKKRTTKSNNNLEKRLKNIALSTKKYPFLYRSISYKSTSL